ncbi:hypothetical protein BC833DRAFT_185729 [Globomyces pollinis-pini]|nr:hypothetical protein BC833DRAFT_185729 [Globomyces pollinis-pini]
MNSTSKDDSDTKMSELQEDFKCPICLDQIVKTTITSECMHRFCHECIYNYLRVVKHDKHESCPICRCKLTRRSLRDDTRFDELIRLFGVRGNEVSPTMKIDTMDIVHGLKRQRELLEVYLTI